jgi:NTP pyrophosphatase (non-canonical NTP hydrolase)
MLNETPRASVQAFAMAMEVGLRANDYKGGWEWEQPGHLMERLREETDELEAALEDWSNFAAPELLERIRKEAADVANFAMMIAQQAGDLDWFIYHALVRGE